MLPRCGLGFPRLCGARVIVVEGAGLCAFGVGYGVGTAVVPGQLRSRVRNDVPSVRVGLSRRCDSGASAVGGAQWCTLDMEWARRHSFCPMRREPDGGLCFE